jgi:hypothetical protein
VERSRTHAPPIIIDQIVQRHNADAMSDGRSENSEEDDDFSVPMPSEVAQQLQIFLDASVWADGIEGQPDRKKGKIDGRLTLRFVWTDKVSAVIYCLFFWRYS